MPATAMSPPKIAKTINFHGGEHREHRERAVTPQHAHDNLPRYHERWIRPIDLTFLLIAQCRHAPMLAARQPRRATPGAPASTSSATTLITRTDSVSRWPSTANAASRSPRQRRAAFGPAPPQGTVDVAADGTTDPVTVEPPWGRFVAGAVRAA